MWKVLLNPAEFLRVAQRQGFDVETYDWGGDGAALSLFTLVEDDAGRDRETVLEAGKGCFRRLTGDEKAGDQVEVNERPDVYGVNLEIDLFHFPNEYVARMAVLVEEDKVLSTTREERNRNFDEMVGREVESDPGVLALVSQLESLQAQAARVEGELQARRAKLWDEREGLRGPYHYVTDEKVL